MPVPPSASPGRRLITVVLVAGTTLLSLNGFLLAHQWRMYAETVRSLSGFRIFCDVLWAIEAVSAERGPTNGALGESLPIPPVRIAALKKARIESDARVRRLLNDLAAENCAACAEQRQTVKQAFDELSATRSSVDTLLQLPRSGRADHEVEAAVQRMIGVIPQFALVTQASVETVVQGDPDALNYLIVARLATILRDQAGQLGSRFTAALVSGRPLTQAEEFAIERTMGRIDQLRALIDSRVQDPASQGPAFAHMNAQYFGDGLAYIAWARGQAARPGGVPVTTTLFAQRYVPLMQPIIVFRDDVLALAKAEIISRRDAELTQLAGLVAVWIVLVVALSLSVWLLRQQVIRPFAVATRIIRAIAAGDFSIRIPQRAYPGEIAALFDAMKVLRSNGLERMRLEQERRELIAQLTVMAETDSLTRLLNRRAFESRARAICLKHDAPPSPLALVMFDLDHFKRVNDTYGHATGDRALQAIADLCRETWRRSDLVARIGGEEFAVLIEGVERAGVLDMVQRFRKRLSTVVVTSDAGATFTMTTSFGVAIDLCTGEPQLASLLRRADKLLYRAKARGRDRVEVDETTTVAALP